MNDRTREVEYRKITSKLLDYDFQGRFVDELEEAIARKPQKIPALLESYRKEICKEMDEREKRFLKIMKDLSKVLNVPQQNLEEIK